MPRLVWEPYFSVLLKHMQQRGFLNYSFVTTIPGMSLLRRNRFHAIMENFVTKGLFDSQVEKREKVACRPESAHTETIYFIEATDVEAAIASLKGINFIDSMDEAFEIMIRRFDKCDYEEVFLKDHAKECFIQNYPDSENTKFTNMLTEYLGPRNPNWGIDEKVGVAPAGHGVPRAVMYRFKEELY